MTDVPSRTWPETVNYKGRIYSKTGKTGRSVRTGLPSAEYEDERDRATRVWLLEDGQVEDECDKPDDKNYRFVTVQARLVVRGALPATLADVARIVAGDSEAGAGTYEIQSVPVNEETARNLANQYGDHEVFGEGKNNDKN